MVLLQCSALGCYVLDVPTLALNFWSSCSYAPTLVGFLTIYSCSSVLFRFKVHGKFTEIPIEVVFPNKPRLEAKCLGSIITSKAHTSTIGNSSTIPLLAKQKDYWKTKSCDATSWAFYAPMESFFLYVSSSSNSISQRCVICYSVIPLAIQIKV